MPAIRDELLVQLARHARRNVDKTAQTSSGMRFVNSHYHLKLSDRIYRHFSTGQERELADDLASTQLCRSFYKEWCREQGAYGG